VNFTYSIVSKRPGDISYMVADVKKLKKILNWKPKHSNLKKMIFSELKWKMKRYK
jgi:UDP-glucose 4-epimerase